MAELNKNLLLKWQNEYDQEYWHGSDREIEETMKEHLLNKFKAGRLYLDKDEFNKICYWKAKRNKRNYSNNSEDYIKYITTQSFSSSNDRFIIEVLTLLNGVQYPVASTILHFAFPDKYPIIDWRVLWSLCRLGFTDLKQPAKYTFDFYHKYMTTIRSLSEKYGLNIRVIDKALWKYADNKGG
jgi:hypothetical protein